MILVFYGDEYLVTAVTGQVNGSQCTDEDADVFGNGLQFQTCGLGRDKGGKEAQGQ